MGMVGKVALLRATNDRSCQTVAWLGDYGVQRLFQYYFSYILAVSAIGGGN